MADKAFRLGNMCDDLVDLTIEMCGKDEDKCPRFPKWSYATLVDRIMNTAHLPRGRVSGIQNIYLRQR